HQPTLDARVPLGHARRLARLHAHVCRLVDQPARHRHAASITSGSPRSPKTAAERLQSSAATVAATRVEASCSSRRRRNSLRDTPSAAASASMRSTAAALSPRISTFAIATTSTKMLSRYHPRNRAPPDQRHAVARPAYDHPQGAHLHVEAELHRVPARRTIYSQWLPSPSAQVDVAFRSQLERGDRADEDRLTSLVHDMFAITLDRLLAGKDRSPATMGEDLDRTMLHASACHGSTSLTPVCTKSFTLRVAQVAPYTRQIAAICASAVLIGAPAFSRATSTSA